MAAGKVSVEALQGLEPLASLSGAPLAHPGAGPPGGEPGAAGFFCRIVLTGRFGLAGKAPDSGEHEGGVPSF